MIRNEATNGPIGDGMIVYGADGEKLGTVRNYNPESGYVDIQKGWLFHKDFYVGLAAIGSVDKHGITLHLNKEQLKDEHSLHSIAFSSLSVRPDMALRTGKVNHSGSTWIASVSGWC